MAPNQSKITDKTHFLVIYICCWSTLPKTNKQTRPSSSPLPITVWKDQSGLQMLGQLTYSNIPIKEMIEKDVTTFGHLCVRDVLGRTTMNFKQFEETR